MSEIDKPVRKTYPTNRERDEEIERLRGEIAVAEQVGGKLMEEREQLGHEIERLRAALVADDEGSTAYQSGWHARDAEIERLRDHIKFLNSFRPDAELARLRGLLREGLEFPGGEPEWLRPWWDEEWKNRVREALSE